MPSQNLLGRIVVQRPEPDRRIIAAAGDDAACGSRRPRSQPLVCLLEGLEAAPAGDLPDSRRSIKAAAGQQPAVGGKASLVTQPVCLPEPAHLLPLALSRTRITPIGLPACQLRAVGAPAHTIDIIRVRVQCSQAGTALEIPDLDGLIIAGTRKPFTIRGSNALHRVAVPLQRPDQRATGGIPELDRCGPSCRWPGAAHPG